MMNKKSTNDRCECYKTPIHKDPTVIEIKSVDYIMKGNYSAASKQALIDSGILNTTRRVNLNF
jgi:hypothetical protein